MLFRSRLRQGFSGPACMMEKKITLAKFSNYRTGGPADFFVESKNIAEIESALNWAKENNQKVFILGGGTNVLFSDDGFKGLVIKISNAGFKFENTKLYAGAGVLMSDLINACIDKELTGLEWAGGLPGTLGGAIRGNAGCFGGEIKDNIESVTAVNYQGQVIKFNNQECKFSYRHSLFKEEKLIVMEAVLNLRQELTREKIAEIAKSHINYRKEHQPLEYPNCGSVFKNVAVEKAPEWVREKFKAVIKTDPFPVIPTAALIHEAGLKGHTIGGAQVSEKHPNFIINIGNATSVDIVCLRDFVVKKVKNKFDVDLETEVEFLT